MDGSILTSVKATLGLAEDHEEFDPEIILHVNTAFFTLRSLGVGPKEGFQISDKEAVWEEFIPDDPTYNAVPTLVGLKVRLLFDPPESGYQITAFERQIAEMEWRLNERREATEWVNPTPPPEVIDPWPL